METKKKTEMTLEQMRSDLKKILAEAKAEAAKMTEEAKAEAAKIVEEAKASVAPKGMSSEELEKARAYANELVEVELFKDNGKYADDVFVSVNGETCLIKRGERVKIKRKFAEVLDKSYFQSRETAKLIEKETSGDKYYGNF